MEGSQVQQQQTLLPTGWLGSARAALVQGLVNATKSYSQVVAFKNCSVQLHKVEI